MYEAAAVSTTTTAAATYAGTSSPDMLATHTRMVDTAPATVPATTFG